MTFAVMVKRFEMLNIIHPLFLGVAQRMAWFDGPTLLIAVLPLYYLFATKEKLSTTTMNKTTIRGRPDGSLMMVYTKEIG